MDEPMPVLHEEGRVKPHLCPHLLHKLRVGGHTARREADADGIAGRDVDETEG